MRQYAAETAGCPSRRGRSDECVGDGQVMAKQGPDDHQGFDRLVSMTDTSLKLKTF
jgi:hypothetical protein